MVIAKPFLLLSRASLACFFISECHSLDFLITHIQANHGYYHILKGLILLQLVTCQAINTIIAPTAINNFRNSHSEEDIIKVEELLNKKKQP